MKLPQRVRRHHLGAALVLCTLGLNGCKNRNKTLAPVALEGGLDQLDVVGDMRSAPAWAQVERVVLGNGLLVHWLPEPEARGLHLRLLLPTDTAKDPLPAASLNILAEAIRAGVVRNTRGLHLRASVAPRAGRLELIVRAQPEDQARVLRAIAMAMANEPSDKLLATLINAEIKRHTKIGSAEASSNALLAELLGLRREHFHSSLSEVKALDPAALRKQFKVLGDPEQAVLLVHGSSNLAQSEPQLDSLTKGWRTGTSLFASPSESATQRLRAGQAKLAKLAGTTSAKSKGGRILGTPYSRMRSVEDLEVSQRHAVMAVGRIIPTPTAKDRALARLAQRLIAQDADLRLVIAGPVSVVILRARVSANNAKSNVASTIDKIERYATESFTQARMSQAARLWLGARVVSASLEDEDWTALYSEALDLAQGDRDAAEALAIDARAMLELTPKELQTFTQRWFAPKTGEVGWHWWIAGANEQTLGQLEPLMK